MSGLTSTRCSGFVHPCLNVYLSQCKLCAELYNKNVLVFYTWPIIDFVNPWNITDFTLLYILRCYLLLSAADAFCVRDL
jgi:hypothetical protein